MRNLIVVGLMMVLGTFSANAQQGKVQRDTIYDLYVVKHGENLYRIARKEGADLDLIVKANEFKDKNVRITVGQRIVLPKIVESVVTSAPKVPVKSLKVEKEPVETEQAVNSSYLQKLNEAKMTLIRQQYHLTTINYTIDSLKREINFQTNYLNQSKPKTADDVDAMMRYMEISRNQEKASTELRAALKRSEADYINLAAEYQADKKEFQRRFPELRNEFRDDPFAQGVDAAQTSEQSAEAEYLSRIKILGDEQDLSEVEDDPKLTKARFYLTRAVQELDAGNISTGHKYVKKALKKYPNYFKAQVLNGDLELKKGNYAKAVKAYSLANITNFGSPQVYYNRGFAYVKLNKRIEAYQDFDKAIELDDKHLLSYAGRASLYLDDKNYSAAADDFSKAIELNEFYTPAFRGRALANVKMQNHENAVTDFSQVLEFEPFDPYSYYKRGESRIATNDLYGACEDFLNASKFGFKHANKLLNRHCE